ncbi:Hypothetical protein BAN_0075301 [Borrelia anserina BA2]|uniref:Uncharacterized protein n=2 Tax=Borrelia anserina TaxID=143 RepID=W5SNE0_BORAN|nr:Hypothetical protein BAN_0075301 [Borrelia anserina BA2]APR64865.1 hypothetical protein N187_01920 [Borrelia anserina Es]
MKNSIHSIINLTRFFVKYKLLAILFILKYIGNFDFKEWKGKFLCQYPDLVNTDLNLKLSEIDVVEEHDKNFFIDGYYRNLILSDKNIGLRLHKVLLDYLSSQSEQEGNRIDKYRRIINIYWEFLKSIIKNVLNLTIEQKILLRFAAFLSSTLGNELKSLISY